jgi:hypothetical protein
MKTKFLLPIVLVIAGLQGVELRAAYVDEVLADNPVGYWRLNEVAPVLLPDPAQNLGTLGALAEGVYLGKPRTAQPGALAGRADTAVTFAGGQMVEVPYSFELNPYPPFTVEFWVRPDTVQTGDGLVSPLASLRRVTPAAEGWIFYQSAAGWNYRQGDSENNYTVNITAAAVIETNSWYHLAAVYDGQTVVLYVNGQQAATASDARYSPNPQVALGIGARGDRAFAFNGSVDEVAIYSKALGAAQIAQRYANGTSASPATAYEQLIMADQPLAYWRLNEPELPPYPAAVNIGTLGAAANGAYFNGATGGEPGAIVGDSNGGATFDGIDDKIDVPYHPGLNNSNAITIECWARVTGGGGHRAPVSLRDDTPAGNGEGLIIYAAPDNRWEFWTGDGAPWHVVQGSWVTEWEWAHLVATFDGLTKKFFVNGELVGSVTRASPLLYRPNRARPFRIGAGANEGNGNYFFSGEIDEVAVYDVALPEHRVLAHYKTGSAQEPLVVLPELRTQPQSLTVFLGQPVIFSANVVGSLPLSYQWTRNGIPITGATNSILRIPAPTLADDGVYALQVSNPGGTEFSQDATLTVQDIAIPVITQQPQPISVLPGGTAIFRVQATGSTTFSYQWQYNGADLPNQTNATLTLTGVQTAQAGNYRVQVRNPAGSTASDDALLKVIVIPETSYREAIVADGPVSYWRLGESSGDFAADAMGRNPGEYLNGVVYGQPGAISGDIDTAAGFVTASQTKVEVPYSPGLNSVPFSAELWARVSGGSGHRSPLTSRNDFPQQGYIFYADPSNQWQFWSGTGEQVGWDIISGPAVRNNAWTHLVATYDGEIKRFYVDGLQAGTSTAPFGPNDGTVLRIGGGASENPVGSFFFQGSVDEVAIYDKVLTPEQIQIHYGIGTRSVAPLSISAAKSAAGVVLTWSEGSLQEADAIAGQAWRDVAASSPHTVTPAGAQKFYRVRR